MYKILVVEDDAELLQIFTRALSLKGYAPLKASSGAEALDILDTENAALIITDIMMPGIDGFQLIRMLRDAKINTPILVITAKNNFQDMRVCFEYGADDYMMKPINLNEMLLRVAALLRRAGITGDHRQTVGSTVLDLDSLTVYVGSRRIALPQKEFQLFYKLASSPGKIMTRQQLMDDIWGYESESESRTIDVHINHLREKFKDNRDFEILTVRGLGYKLETRTQ